MYHWQLIVQYLFVKSSQVAFNKNKWQSLEFYKHVWMKIKSLKMNMHFGCRSQVLKIY